MSIIQLYLARHGETLWNCEKRLQGRLNSALTANGRQQATSLAELISKQQIGQIVSSPLGRAIDTAGICAAHLNKDVVINECLVERNFGDWQGRYFDSLSNEKNFESVFYQVTEQSPPNGESGIECANRIEKAIKTIGSQINSSGCTNSALVITHGDAIRCLMSQLTSAVACDAYSQYGNGKIFPLRYHIDSEKINLE